MFYQSVWFWVIAVLLVIVIVIIVAVLSRINKIGGMMEPGKKEKVKFCPKCHSMVWEKTQICSKCGAPIQPTGSKKNKKTNQIGRNSK
ncbi:hypothetical protein LLG10_00140 [bacterium]|nr:hypothetical protein [bacterium]